MSLRSFVAKTFDVNTNALSLHSFVASFKKMPLKSDFIQVFFMIKYMYIASGQEPTTPRGQNFDVNRKALSLYPFVASFKEISLNSDFLRFFFFVFFLFVFFCCCFFVVVFFFFFS